MDPLSHEISISSLGAGPEMLRATGAMGRAGSSRDRTLSRASAGEVAGMGVACL